MSAPCGCQRVHRPRATVTQLHHVVPQSWEKAGATPASPKTVPLCGTAHDLVHDLLNKYVKADGPPPLLVRRAYPRLVQRLAAVAWEARPHGRPPLTLAAPEPPAPVFEVAPMTLAPDDVLVLHAAGPVTSEEARALHDRLGATFKDHRVVVVDSGARLTAGSASDAEVLEALVRADSLLSLVAHRYPTGLPSDVVSEMKDASHLARRLYEGERQ